jgi:hypothetical protein
MLRWAGNVAWMGENRNAHWIWVGKREGKRLLGTLSHRLGGGRHIYSIHLAQDKNKWWTPVNTAMEW